MSDPTKIRGFRNVSASHQAVFITEDGEVKISRIGPRRWKVLPRGGEAYEVSGKQKAIEEARGIATGLTPSRLREMQEKQRRLQSSLLAEPPKKSSAQIKREINEVLARKPGNKNDRPAHATLKGRAVPSSTAVDFFRKHAGYAVRPGESKVRAKTRGAQALARAEAEAEARGWTVDWEHDPEPWQGDVERPFEVLTAVLRDAEGRVLASLGSVGMTGNRKTDADYGRVVEAELADEALGQV